MSPIIGKRVSRENLQLAGGKIYLSQLMLGVVLSGSVLTSAQSVQLTARDTFGQSTTQAIAGVPFILDLDVKTTQQKTIKLVQIAGLAQTTYQSNGVTSRLSVMNGSAQSQRTYSYLVRLDQPGHYQLGPAQVTLGDEAVNSNQLTITVLASTEENLAQQAAEQLANGSNVSSVQTARSDTRPALTSNTGHDSAARSNSVSEHQPQTSNAAPAQIKLLCQQPQAYVGEKVPITIRVYTNSNDLKLTNLQQLQAPDFQLGELIKGAAGVTTLNGASYFYQDYTQLLTPTKAGDFLIPAIALDYAAPAGRQNWFWFTSYVQRQAYSNSLKLQIKPLPTPATSLPAPVLVGAFTGFKAQLAKATLAPGEGTVFSLTVTVPAERTYDLAEVQLDRLELGPALRAYFSKATDIAPNQRRFEFVLQGLRSGAFTIPAQKLNFFHPVIRKYQTLSTTPMAVTITGTQTVASDQAVTSSAAPTAWPLLTVNQVAGAWPRWLRPLPLSLAWLLFLVPFLGVLSLLVHYLFQLYAQRPPVVRQRALARALKRLHKCQRAAQVYEIYGQLFKRLGRVDTNFSAVQADWQWPNLAPAQQARWQKLWQQMLQAAFAPETLTAGQQQAVIEAAQQWVQDLVDGE